jgi:hypothetical protein
MIYLVYQDNNIVAILTNKEDAEAYLNTDNSDGVIRIEERK